MMAGGTTRPVPDTDAKWRRDVETRIGVLERNSTSGVYNTGGGGGGGAPSGPAGGVLTGSYPNPGFASDMATQAELDAAVSGLNTTLTGKENTGVAIPKSLIDAKGDLLVGSADNSVARLPLSGTNGRQLTEDSTQANGLRWADPNIVGVGAPVGTIHAYGGGAAPAGFLLCDGSVYTQAAYPDLYAIIGTTYNTGVGDTGVGQFRVPDLRGRFAMGAGTATGVNGATAHALGTKGGEETHVLSTGEMPSHSHGVSDPGHAHYWQGQQYTPGGGPGAYINPGGGLDASFVWTNSTGTGVSVNSAGGGGAHNNLPPFVAVTYIIQSVKAPPSTGIAPQAKYSETRGDGVATVFRVNHLLNMTDLSAVTIRDLASGEVIYTRWVVVDANNIDVTISPAPALNSKRITVTA